MRFKDSLQSAAVVLLLALTCAGQQKTAIVADAAIRANGDVVRPAVLLIEKGRIVGLGDVEIPEGYHVVRRPGFTLAPGLVDVGTHAGAPFDLSENEDAVDLESRARDALVLRHRDWKLLAAAGITSTVLLPDPESVVSGVGVVVKTGGDRRIVDRAAPLVLALSGTVYERARRPTSFAEAVALLEGALEAAKTKGGAGPLVELLGSKRPSVFVADSEAGLKRGLRLAARYGFKPAFHASKAVVRRALPEIRAAEGGVFLLDAPSDADSAADLLLPRDLAAAGGRIAFRVDVPKLHPDALRLGAWIAVRQGLSRGAAIEALTARAAEVAGCGGRLGDLEAGRDADFIVLNGDLLDPASRVQETWVAGRRIYRMGGSNR